MLRKIENPMPHFVEAADAAQRYLKAQREHVVLLTEIQAHAQSRRAIWLAAGGVIALLGVFWACYWGSWALREQGLSSELIAIAWLVTGALLTGTCVALASRAARSAHPARAAAPPSHTNQESA